MKNTKRIFLIGALIFQLFLICGALQPWPVQYAQAVNLWDRQIGFKGPGEIGLAFDETGSQPTSLQVIISRLIRIFLSLIGVIFLILLVVAGVRWMTSGGNEQTVTSAKSQIIAAVIGLIIIMMAYSITSYITSCVYDLNKNAAAIWNCKP